MVGRRPDGIDRQHPPARPQQREPLRHQGGTLLRREIAEEAVCADDVEPRAAGIVEDRGDDGFDSAAVAPGEPAIEDQRSEEHTSELQSLMRSSYTVFCLQ